MARRIHVPVLRAGDTPLDERQAHHARDVLRLPHGTPVEVFDDAGATADATVLWDAPGPRVCVPELRAQDSAARGRRPELVIAAAVPKGDRADWMVEKLSELDVAEFIPLAAARSVVLPEGKGKRERWVRIATEAAKQSRRAGVMRIGELTPIEQLLNRAGGDLEGSVRRWCLSTEQDALPIADELPSTRTVPRIVAFVGPEGGWTSDEISAFDRRGVQRVTLAGTVLRIETAAIAVASLVAASALRGTGSGRA